MKESQKNNKSKPGLEEALHPEIANESAWSMDDHIFSLSTVDPLKSLDQHLLDEDTATKTLQQWKAQWQGAPPDENSPLKETHTEEKEIRFIAEAEQETQLPDETEKTTESITIIPVEERIVPSETEQMVYTPKKEKKKKEKDPFKASKRIRKLAEKVKKEEETQNEQNSKTAAVSPETNLSPFTHWLKGLTGSEYVHPYEDDFAFHRGGEQAGEGISETFADLLAAQGYKDQAIAMYTRLIEKFPEKSRFFAAKIEALQ